MIAINGTANHLHTLFRLSRRRSLAEVVEKVKAESSRWIKTQGREFANFYWQAGYGAFTIGQSSVDVVTGYIGNQKRRHQQESYQDEYRSLLRKYKVEFDERYVWD